MFSLLLGASDVLAQPPGGEPGEEPASRQTAAEASGVAPGEEAAGPEALPAPAPAIPGLNQTDFLIRPALLLQEGTFLTRAPGRMVRLPTGEWAVVFSPDERGVALRPMVLIPSLTLQRMEQAIEDRTASLHVSGEVFVYMGVNYLLPDAFSMMAPAAAPERPAMPVETPAKPPAPGEDPAIEELIRDLELQRQRPRVVDPAGHGLPDRPEVAPPGQERADPATGAGQLAGRVPGDAAGALIPDRQRLDRRRGRMVRLAGGEWAVVFDTGTQHEPGLDRPLVLVPSLNLQRMQAWAGRAGDSTTLEVSGRVLQYRGRNYLIPTLYRVYPEMTALRPIQ